MNRSARGRLARPREPISALTSWLRSRGGYFRALDTSLNSPLSRVPNICRDPTMKTAIRDDINAYSIAVAPLSSRVRFNNMFSIHADSESKLRPIMVGRGSSQAIVAERLRQSGEPKPAATSSPHPAARKGPRMALRPAVETWQLPPVGFHSKHRAKQPRTRSLGDPIGMRR